MANPAFDLIQHYRIATEITHEHTIHTYTAPDPNRQRRRAQITQRWSRVKRLGQGGFGTVYLEKDDKGELRAVKRVPKSMNDRSQYDNLRELLSISTFSKDSTNFPVFYGWFDDIENIYIAMEFFPLGDLDQCLKDNNQVLPESEVQQVIFQLAEALETIHEHFVTHRDVKPNNIFVMRKSPNWWVKLGDFGISKRIQNQNQATNLYTIFLGPFVAPEIVGILEMSDEMGTTYTSAVDIWSLGCLTFWCLALDLPFSAQALRAYCQTQQIPAETLKKLNITEFGLEFLKACLAVQPQKRPSATSALSYPWLSSFHGGESISNSAGKAIEVSSRNSLDLFERRVDNIEMASPPELNFPVPAHVPGQLLSNISQPVTGLGLDEQEANATQQVMKPDHTSESPVQGAGIIRQTADEEAYPIVFEKGPNHFQRALITKGFDSTDSNVQIKISEKDMVDVVDFRDDGRAACRITGQDIILDRSMISAPHIRMWAQTGNRAKSVKGVFFRVLRQQRSIEIIEHGTGTVVRKPYYSLTDEDRRYASMWTSVSMLDLLELGKPTPKLIVPSSNKRFRLDHIDGATHFIGHLEGFTHMMLVLSGDNPSFIPVEWLRVETMERLQQAFNATPEAQIANLFPFLLDDQHVYEAVALEALEFSRGIRELRMLRDIDLFGSLQTRSLMELQFSSLVMKSLVDALAKLHHAPRGAFPMYVEVKNKSAHNYPIWLQTFMGSQLKEKIVDVVDEDVFIYTERLNTNTSEPGTKTGTITAHRIRQMDDRFLYNIGVGVNAPGLLRQNPFRSWRIRSLDRLVASRRFGRNYSPGQR